MNPDSLIFVAGHRGLVGSALVRRLQGIGCKRLVLRTRAELDLERQIDVDAFFSAVRPEYVFLAAAKVGGIWGNNAYPADFLISNLGIELNVMSAAHRYGTQKLMFLGSSCIYPRLAHQPMKEESLLTGPLEPTNEAYAIAKIAGIKLCQAYTRQYGANFISVMPTNLYGPGDNFDLKTSHVLPALIRKFHEAKAAGSPQVIVWGTGTPKREFLHVDDMANACVYLMERYDSPEIINIGYGEDIEISGLAAMISEVVGYEGRVMFDTTKPDGPPRKLLDTTRLRELGWKPGIRLRDGLAATYRWYVEQLEHQASAVA